MPFFADSEQFYEVTRALFAQIQEQDPSAADPILASRLIIRLRGTDPDLEITIDGRQRPVQTFFGPSALRPTLDIDLPADTLHRIMLGQESLKAALARGQVNVRGPVWKARSLGDLFRAGQSLYPEILEERGLLEP